MRQNINRDELVKYSFGRLVARCCNEMFSTEAITNIQEASYIINDLGFEVNNSYNEVGLFMRNLKTSVENRVDSYLMSNPDVFMTPKCHSAESKAYLLMCGLEEGDTVEEEDTEDEIEKELDEKIEKSESNVGTIVADLIKEVLKADSKEVEEIADKIVAINRDVTEDKKDTEKDKSDSFSTSEIEEGDDDSEGGTAFNENSEDPWGTDDKDNSDSSSSDDDKDGSDKTEDEGSNPFDSASSDDDNKGDEGSNPFNDDDSSEGGNPFDGATKESGNESLNKDVWDMSEITFRTLGLENLNSQARTFKPFEDFNNSSIRNYVFDVTERMFKPTFDRVNKDYGMESTQMNSVKELYAESTRNIMHTTIRALVLAEVMGNENINTLKILDPAFFNVV